jgi:hypothetical protein
VSIFERKNPRAEEIDYTKVPYSETADFITGYQRAYEAQVRGSSIEGIDYQLMKAYGENSSIIAKGLEGGAANRAMFSGQGFELSDVPYHLAGEKPFTGESLKSYNAYNQRILELQSFGVEGLRTLDAVWSDIKSQAQIAESAYSQGPSSFTGSVGGFIGGMLGSLDPRTDPLNFLTLPVGGIGKTIAGRIGTQMGAQGAVETVNQFTGVQENRRLLGLDYGLKQAFTTIAGTAIGAGVLQGAGEGLAVGVRRWFNRSSAEETIPPPPPKRKMTMREKYEIEEEYRLETLKSSPFYRASPEANVLFQEDVRAAASLLDDWGRLAPTKVTFDSPPTSSYARPSSIAPAIVDAEGVGPDNLTSLARFFDPVALSKQEELTSRKVDLESYLSEVQSPEAKGLLNTIERTKDDISILESAQARASKEDVKKLKKRKRVLNKKLEEDEANLSKIQEGDDTRTKTAYKDLVRLNRRIRKNSVMVARAYSRATGSWSIRDDALDAMLSSVRKSQPFIPEGALTKAPSVGSVKPSFVAKAVAGYPEIKDQLPSDSTAGDTMRKVVEAEEGARSIEEEGLISTALNLRNSPDTKTVRVGGLDLDLDGIKMVVESEKGPITVTPREVLEDLAETMDELEAFRICQV